MDGLTVLAAARATSTLPPSKGRQKQLNCTEGAPDALIAGPMTHRKETTMGIRSAWAARFIRSIAPVACIAAALNAQTARAGTWTRLTNNAPGAVNLMILLSDGTVMALATDGGATIPNGWYKLTPDSHGSYINGTWTTLAPMNDTRLYFSSAVLPDGRVLAAGGEYGTGGPRGEVYDPLTNVWTQMPIPAWVLDPTQPSPVIGHNQTIYDADSKVTVGGRVLISPVAPMTTAGTIIFDPQTNSWLTGPTLFRGSYQDEASWVKLPDQTILTIDPFGTNSERYDPVSNSWIDDGIVPVSLYDPYGFELGAALLTPDGRAFFLGSTGHTAFYQPSGTTSPGTWTQGPDLPNGQGTPDAPAAMMANGVILCVTSPAPTTASHFPTPISFYEFNTANNVFTRVSGPTGLTAAEPAYKSAMLDLPDGTVLYSHEGTDVYVYNPNATPLAAGKPVVTSITQNPDGTFHLAGLQLNGISEGAAFGDDLQMDSNYPLVRLVSGTNVFYCRTFNWSSTGVMTGSTPVSTEFSVPANLPPAVYSLYAVANGIASDPVSFSPFSGVAFAGTGANTIDDTTGNGNSNGRIDPGESSIHVLVPIQNAGGTTATSVSGVLTSNTGTASVTGGTSAYPDLAWTATATNITPFVISVSPSHPCGDPISLTLTLSSAQSTGVYNFSLPTALTGVLSSPFTRSYTGPVVAIPDYNSAGVSAPLSISGVPGTIADVNFRFDGSACTAAAGATTVGLDHTWVADLTVTLISPSGTVVTLMSTPGGPNNGGNNFCNTVLDDQATGGSIQNITASGAPWSGTYTPMTPLAAFNGENPNGTWQLHAVDGGPGDTGHIRAFSIIVTTILPPSCDPPVTCTAPGINTGPAAQSPCVGQPVTFGVAATGTAPLSYQWRKDTNAIGGATDASYTIASVSQADAGSYDCVVSNSCGSLPSVAAPLRVNSADFNGDGDSGTDADIEAFFACVAGNCCPTCGSADFNNDGDSATDQDIEAFFRVLSGGAC
jgi:subtilisin-like proprotein convertase family protein